MRVAWTFNIRGGDVAHTPLPLAFAIVPHDGRPSLYVDGRKLTDRCATRSPTSPRLREPDAFGGRLEALGAAHATVRLDQATAADAHRPA